MTLEDSVHAIRLRLMARAQALGNVSQACREFGISRCLFYRWRKRYLAYGPDGLHPRWTGVRRGRPPMVSVQAERAILALAIACPTWGPVQLAFQLRRPRHGGWRVAPSTIYRLLRRSGLQTRWERLAVLEAHSARAAGLLTPSAPAGSCWPHSGGWGATYRPRDRASWSVWTPSISASSKAWGKSGS